MIKNLFAPYRSEIVTLEFIDHMISIYKMDHFGYHGFEHWLCVLYNGRLIADAIQANTKVIELFSLLHDTQRQKEDYDPEHGPRAAQYAETIRNVSDIFERQISAANNHQTKPMSSNYADCGG